MFRILVLKDGQIVEQGSHKELLELDGIFASMWADQIATSDDPAVRPLAVQGYSVEDKPAETASGLEAAERPTQDTSNDEDAPEAGPVEAPAEEAVAADVTVPNADDIPTNDVTAPSTHDEPGPILAEDAPVAFPSSPDGGDDDEQIVAAAGPSEEPAVVSSPIEFPTSDDASASNANPPVSSPGITFAPEVSSAGRTGTPDPESEPKRKRISSQNFQRLARRISLSTKRQGSTSSSFPSIPSIPGLKRDASKDESAAGGSVRGDSVTDAVRTESPVPSVQGSDGGKEKEKKKKDRKKLRRSMSGSAGPGA